MVDALVKTISKIEKQRNTLTLQIQRLSEYSEGKVKNIMEESRKDLTVWNGKGTYLYVLRVIKCWEGAIPKIWGSRKCIWPTMCLSQRLKLHLNSK